MQSQSCECSAPAQERPLPATHGWSRRGREIRGEAERGSEDGKRRNRRRNEMVPSQPRGPLPSPPRHKEHREGTRSGEAPSPAKKRGQRNGPRGQHLRPPATPTGSYLLREPCLQRHLLSAGHPLEAGGRALNKMADGRSCGRSRGRFAAKSLSGAAGRSRLSHSSCSSLYCFQKSLPWISERHLRPTGTATQPRRGAWHRAPPLSDHKAPLLHQGTGSGFQGYIPALSNKHS